MLNCTEAVSYTHLDVYKRQDGQFAAVADNECGVLIGLTSWFNEINAKYGEGTADKLTMIPYYIGENDTIYQSTSTQFYIPKDGKNIDVSKHFINWCAKDENLQAFYDSIGAVSPFKDIEPSLSLIHIS